MERWLGLTEEPTKETGNKATNQEMECTEIAKGYGDKEYGLKANLFHDHFILLSFNIHH